MYRILPVLLLSLAPLAAHAFPTFAKGEGFRGAELMTQEERQAHVSYVQSVKTFDECRAYMDSHDQEIERRAQAQHVTLPGRLGDPCQVMRFFGRIK